jgi:GNAT superfamily N-acetyltransferase
MPESPSSAITIRPAGPADLDLVRTLFREYQAWLGVDLCFQSFEEELASLPGRYAPPTGRLLLAEHAGAVVGVIASRQIEPGVCEMKRLFVRPAAHGLGIGRALAERLIDETRAAGFRAMRLDTIADRMGTAVALYERLGFRDIPAYTHNPEPSVRYLELVFEGGGDSGLR